jgi:hypothetical protein
VLSFIKKLLRGRIPMEVARRVNPRLVQPKDMPDWTSILGTNRGLWDGALANAKGKKVLIATNVGGHGPVSVMESMLAVALTLRGAEVRTLLCDGVLPGCLRAEHADLPDPQVLVDRKLPETICGACKWRGEAMVAPLGTGIDWIGQNVTLEERTTAREIAETVPYAEIGAFRFDDLAVGEHAKAGALRYFARGDLSTEPQGEPVMRRYLEAAMMSVFAVRRLIERYGFDVAVFHHGLYVPQGIVGEVCRSMGVRVVNWYVSYRRQTFVFSHGDTYHHTLMTEPVSTWHEMAWSADHRESIAAYLKSRWFGSRDWISFHEKPVDIDRDFAEFAAATGLDLDKPIIGMLTNVVWDAQLHYPANAFPDMIAWAVETIRYFETRPDLQLLIRIHPAEIRGTAKSRQPIMENILQAFPTLPPNVFVIPPESPVSTYVAAEHCDSVIIYGTKTGVELTSMGIPTIVAGEAWIRGKGLTRDANSVAEYREILDTLPVRQRMPDDVVEMALRYAYHFFFRRMIPLDVMQPNGKGTLFSVAVDKLDELLPGRDRGLDVVMDGILAGTPFVFPAEVVGVHDS